MLITREDARLLGKIGFMGLWQGRFAESESIFSALKDADPKRIGPLLGLGMAAAHRGEYARAIDIFQNQALVLDPDDEHAKAWLGLALFRDGNAQKAREILEPVAQNGKAEDAKALAKGVLEELAASA